MDNVRLHELLRKGTFVYKTILGFGIHLGGILWIFHRISTEFVTLIGIFCAHYRNFIIITKSS